MKNWNSSFLISVLFLMNSVLSWGQDYSRKPIASIHHYAERLMGFRVAEKKEDVNFRTGMIYYYKELDIPGDYVHISGGYTGDYFLAQWKMKDGRDLIGVTHYNCQAHCVYECTFYAFTKSDSSDVSPEVFPLKKMVKHMNKIKKKVLKKKELQDETAQFKFIMPRAGEALRVYISMDKNRIEFPLLDLRWNGLQFEVSSKYKEIPDL